jgi:adenylylsulfate kinase-like enzyme
MKEGFTVWLTGYQGTGKRAISDELARILAARHLPVEQFDVRTPGLDVLQSADPTESGRYERRLGFLASALNRHGVAVIVATMSPSRQLREELKAGIPRFMEVYVKRRDPIPGRHYEEPLAPDVEVAAATEAATAAVRIARVLEDQGLIPRGPEAAAAEAEEQQIIKRLKDFGYM